MPKRRRHQENNRLTEVINPLFKTMADCAPVQLWMTGRDARCIFFNKAWLEFSGKSMQEEIGFGWAEGVHPEDFQHCITVFMQAFNEEKPFSMEYRLERHDGQYRWLLDNGAPYYDEMGQFAGFIGSCIDITDRKRAEYILRKSEEEYRTIAESIPQIVWSATPEGQVTYLSQNWSIYTGQRIDRQQHIKQDWLAFIHPEDKENVFSKWQNALRNHNQMQIECRLRGKDNIYKWFLIKALPLKVQSNEVIKWFGTATEIDEKKKLALKNEILAQVSLILEESFNYKQTFVKACRSLIPKIVDWCFISICRENVWQTMEVCAQEQEKMYLARKLKKYLQHSNHNFLKINDEVFLKNSSCTNRFLLYKKELSDHDAKELSYDHEHYCLLKQLAPVSLVMCPLSVGKKKFGQLVFISSRSDYLFCESEIRLFEEFSEKLAVTLDKAYLYQKAKESNRLKDEFLANISHELRTPVNALLGLTKELGNEQNDKDRHQICSLMKKHALHQAHLVNNVFDVVSLLNNTFKLNIQKHSLKDIILNAVDSQLSSAEEKNINIVLKLSPSIELITSFSCDRTRLIQALAHMLANSIKFSYPDSTITVEADIFDQKVRLRVLDSGEGIDSNFLPHVFDRFIQEDGSTSRRHGGLGVGLYLVHEIIKLHSGKVIVESAGKERGACFSIEMPISIETQTQARSLQLEGRNILVVEDDAATLNLLQRILLKYGANVIGCYIADDAFKVLGDKDVDAIICDIGLPGMDGFSFIKEVRNKKETSRIPAVAVSAYSFAKDKRKAIKCGFQQHISKPFDSKELVSCVSQMIEQIQIKE